jgi:hypothetical protein
MKRRTILKTAPIFGLAGCSSTPSEPNVGIVKREVAGREVPLIALRAIERNSITIAVRFYVDNTMNDIGGTVKSVNYKAYWSQTEDGPWSKLGPGEVGEFDIPAGEVVQKDGETTIEEEKSVAELVAYLGKQETAYILITGTITAGIGDLFVEADFEEKRAFQIEEENDDSGESSSSKNSENTLEKKEAIYNDYSQLYDRYTSETGIQDGTAEFEQQNYHEAMELYMTAEANYGLISERFQDTAVRADQIGENESKEICLDAARVASLTSNAARAFKEAAVAMKNGDRQTSSAKIEEGEKSLDSTKQISLKRPSAIKSALDL